MATALQIVQKYHHSTVNGTDEWKTLLAEDVVFQGPMNKVKGRKAYIELAGIFFSMVRNYQLLHNLDSKNLAAIEGYYTAMTPSGKTVTLEMAEFYEVKMGRIKSIRIYFDAEEFRREFAATGS